MTIITRSMAVLTMVISLVGGLARAAEPLAKPQPHVKEVLVPAKPPETVHFPRIPIDKTPPADEAVIEVTPVDPKTVLIPVPCAGLPTEPVVVKRQLDFEVSDEVQKMVFEQYDATMLAQRYVARFDVLTTSDPEEGKSKRSEAIMELPSELGLIVHLGGVGQWPGCAQLLQNVPEEHRPAEDIVKGLQTHCDRPL
jgi:hypothetical protein